MKMIRVDVEFACNRFMRDAMAAKEYKYHERKKALKDFEEGMKALFQVPKDAAKEKNKPARSGKTEKSPTSVSDASRNSGEAWRLARSRMEWFAPGSTKVSFHAKRRARNAAAIILNASLELFHASILAASKRRCLIWGFMVSMVLFNS